MISIADLINLADKPQVAYDGYGELRQAARQRNGGFASPADIPLLEEVIRRRGREWCESVIGKPMMNGLRSISTADADMLLVADERGLELALPAWLEQWKAESAETQRRQDEVRDATLRRDQERWDAALATCGVPVEVRPNVNGRRHNTVLNDGPLRHVVPLADARSSRRRHPAGRALCEVRHARTLGEPTGQPATCHSCLRYTAEIRPVHRTS